MSIQTENNEIELTPKSVEIPIPPGPPLYYMQAAIKLGIEHLMQTRKFMELASNTEAVSNITDSMVCMIGLSESLDEIAVENMKEYQAQHTSGLDARFAHEGDSSEDTD